MNVWMVKVPKEDEKEEGKEVKEGSWKDLKQPEMVSVPWQVPDVGRLNATLLMLPKEGEEGGAEGR